MTQLNTSQRILWWLLAAMLGFVMFVLSILAVGYSQMYTGISEDVQENTRLTTKHETDIGYIGNTLSEISRKIDILINEKLARL